jgi:hypothetical protein
MLLLSNPTTALLNVVVVPPGRSGVNSPIRCKVLSLRWDTIVNVPKKIWLFDTFYLPLRRWCAITQGSLQKNHVACNKTALPMMMLCAIMQKHANQNQNQKSGVSFAKN